MELTVKGTTAPAATSPLTLFSTVSSTSNGFFAPGGNTAPSKSFPAHTPTSSSAGSQKFIWANHGRVARSASSFAENHRKAP